MKRRNALLQLSREHHTALVLTLRIARATEADSISALLEYVPKIFDAELEPHFQDEENSLLPRLAAAGETEMVRRTLAEHRELRGLAARIATGDSAALKQFGIALEEHVRFEERQLFSVSEKVLAEEFLDHPGSRRKTDQPRPMKMPDFFDDVPKIRLYDPLADFLGATDGGILEYGYRDAVKLAGHSCPTVAAAFWLTRQSLIALYGDQLPERGGIRVEFADGISGGVTGVMANITSMLTGAASDGGFKGITGKFERRNLLFFDSAIPLVVRLTRLDNLTYVEAHADLSQVPVAPETGALMLRCLSGKGSPEEWQRFKFLWQDRVRKILFEFADDKNVFVVRKSD